jgi:hypothetical protein
MIREMLGQSDEDSDGIFLERMVDDVRLKLTICSMQPALNFIVSLWGEL